MKPLVLILLVSAVWELGAQQTGTPLPGNPPPTVTEPEPYSPQEFPPWLRDLDRGKTLAIGAFPFAYLITSLGYDIYYFFDHDRSASFAPWPAGPGTSQLPQAQQNIKYRNLIIGAVAVSLTLSVGDWILGQYGVYDGSLGP